MSVTSLSPHPPFLALPRALWLPSAAFVLLLGADLVLLAPSPTWLESWAALLVAGLLPGQLLAARLWHNAATPGLGTRLLLGVGLGYGLLIVTLLGLSYLPGGIDFGQTLFTFNVLNGGLLAATIRQRLRSPLDATTPLSSLWHLPSLRQWNGATLALLTLAVGAAYLRFTHIGYSELHGDEALVALRAWDVIDGWERALFIHKKGPGEILLGAAFYVLTGRLTEFAAHLPFALASWCGVLAVYVLGRRWFGVVGAWWAAAMVMVDGYLMAFGRMLQYQSLIFLLVTLTVLVLDLAVEQAQADRNHQRGRHITRYLTVAAFLLATGLLAHYEAAVTVIPGLWLLVCLLRAQGWHMLRRLLVPVVLGTALLAAFYVPFIRDPEFFRDTYYYIFAHRLGGHVLPEGLATIIGRSSLYGGTYYVWTLIATSTAGLLIVYWRTLPRWAAALWSLALAGYMALLLTDTTLIITAPYRLGLTAAMLLFAPAWFAPRLQPGARAAWLWFGVTFTGVIFFVTHPGTHVYIFFIPWGLVSGWVIQQGWDALAQRTPAQVMRYVAAPLLALAVIVLGSYVRWLFVVNSPEILFTWDENRPPGYWTTFDSPNFESIFGFPLRNGWKTVAALYATNVLEGRFDTNDRFSMVPDWYLRGQEYCGRDKPTYFILVPYPLPVDRPIVNQWRSQVTHNHYLWGTVMVNGRPHLEIYARNDRLPPPPNFTPLVLDEAKFAPYFNNNLLDTNFPRNGRLGQQPIPNPSPYRFGDSIHLLGYRVDKQQVAPGGEMTVELYWTTDAPIAANYFVTVQVLDPATNGKAGQRDGEPGCNRFPTSSWVPGDRLFDRYVVPIAGDAAPGDYVLYLALYNDAGTLPVTNTADGSVGGGAVLLPITVVPE